MTAETHSADQALSIPGGGGMRRREIDGSTFLRLELGAHVVRHREAPPEGTFNIYKLIELSTSFYNLRLFIDR